MTVVNLLVEGTVDDAAARRLLRLVGAEPGTTFGLKGNAYIRDKLQRFSYSARVVPLLALADFMDSGESCPPAVCSRWLPHPQPNCVFRVVVREIESWLMADSANFADFIGVSTHRLPSAPEAVDDPKGAVIALARRSRKRQIREGLVPPSGLAASTGPLYTAELARFATNRWNPIAAAANSSSLERCMTALGSLVR